MTALPYLLSRGCFVAGIVIATATQQFWVLMLGTALGVLLGLVDKVIARNATFDAEVDQVIAQIRHEDSVAASDRRAGE